MCSDREPLPQALIGRLQLQLGLENGRSVLRQARCEYPLAVLRPLLHRSHEWLCLIVLTPSGGLLDGDQLEAEVVIDAGAKLDLRTQAATQAHAGRSSQRWRFVLGEQASVSWLPRALVPHAGAIHHSQVSADLAATASLFVAETVAPGRVHQGELFAYDELRLDLDIRREGKLVARERQIIHPEAHSLQARLGLNTHFASAYLFGGSAMDAAELADVEAGTAELAFGGCCVRLLGRRAFDIEQALHHLQRCWRATNHIHPLQNSGRHASTAAAT